MLENYNHEFVEYLPHIGAVLLLTGIISSIVEIKRYIKNYCWGIYQKNATFIRCLGDASFVYTGLIASLWVICFLLLFFRNLYNTSEEASGLAFTFLLSTPITFHPISIGIYFFGILELRFRRKLKRTT